MNYYTYSEIFSSTFTRFLRQTYTNIQKSDKIKKRTAVERQQSAFIYIWYLLQTELSLDLINGVKTLPAEELDLALNLYAILPNLNGLLVGTVTEVTV